MVVHPVNGIVPSTPLRPAPSTFSLAAKMKRGGGARRALSNLGNNDTQANLRLAESLLTVSQEKFAKKWNFDPVEAVPLAPGRYLWAPVTSNQTQSPAESKGMDTVVKGKDILTCFTLPKSGFCHSTTEEPRVPELHPTAEVEADNSQEDATVLLASPNTSSVSLSVEDNNDSGIVTDESLSESPLPARSSPNTTQTTITDYLRCSKKRVLVLDSEEVLPAPKRQHQLPTSTIATSSVLEPSPAASASATLLHK